MMLICFAVIDLLAFTLPLPLFPRLIEDFLKRESLLGHRTILSSTLETIAVVRRKLTSYQGAGSAFAENKRWDVVLCECSIHRLTDMAHTEPRKWEASWAPFSRLDNT